MTTRRPLTLAVILLLAITALTAGVTIAQERAGTDLAANEPAAALAAVGTAFTYQGRLTDGGSPANGAYDLQFLLYDAASGGSQVGSTVTVGDASVSNGLFTAQLDFGAAAFQGDARWLAIRVRPGASGGGYTTLSPRQALTAAPYALGLRPGAVVNGASDTILTLAGGDVGLDASGATTGVSGQSASTSGRGVYGYASATSGGTNGVVGLSASPDGRGVFGYASAASGETYGVFGLSNSTAGRSVYGLALAASGATYGLYGESASTGGSGVKGEATAATGYTIGVFGQSNSAVGRGVYGYASAAGGATYGVYGKNRSTSGSGVRGEATAISGHTSGVYGLTGSTDGFGVSGVALASTGTTYGVYGLSASTAGRGVYGLADASSGTTYGVYGSSASTAGRGVFGYASAASGTNYGVYGQSASASGYAGYFNGKVHVAGTLSKAAGSFKIDHPLDPANQYLYHSFVESPDMMNIYNGNVALDDKGAAWVTLPDWFEALNRDFRYQLTPVGAAMPNLHVAHKIQDNRFQIAGGAAGMEVSWQVTGIRQDAYANAHRIPVEEAKPEEERGLYLYPAELGQPAELGLDYQRNARLDEAGEAAPAIPAGGE